MGGDGGDAQSSGGVPPPGDTADYGDAGETRGRRIVEVPLVSGVNGSRGYPPHRGVHQDMVGNNSGKGGLPPHIWALQRGGADDRDAFDGTMVGKDVLNKPEE